MRKFFYFLQYAKKLFILLGPLQIFPFLIYWIFYQTNPKLIKIKGVATPLYVRRFNSDLNVLLAVFQDRECDISLDFSPEIIIDAGAYVGYTSIFFATKYPKANIIAIEPNDLNCELFRKNCKEYPNIQLLQRGLWISNAPLRILNPHDLGWAYKLEENSARGAESVDGITISDILSDFGVSRIDILKMDIEGTEELIFSDEIGWVNQTLSIIIEVHNKQCEEIVLQVLSDYNFSMSRKGEKLVFITNVKQGIS